MKIDISRYSLHKKNFNEQIAPDISLNSKTESGCLIRCEWPEGLIGFADLFSWKKFGDEDLDIQIQNLKMGKVSFQAQQSIWMARRDALARTQKVSLLEDSFLVKNNYLIVDAKSFYTEKLDEIKKQGFTTIKLKIGQDLKSEEGLIKAIIENHFKLRLDFSTATNYQNTFNYISLFSSSIRKHFEYIEDPCAYHYENWNTLRALVPLAMDHELQNFNLSFAADNVIAFDFMVIKSAKTDVEKTVNFCLLHQLKMTFTSYMDHPVGQMHSLSLAIENKKKYFDLVGDAGCMTHQIYQPNEYSHFLMTNGPYIQKHSGYGIGFDDLLEKEKWVTINSNL